MMKALTLLLNGTPIEKLQFLFKVYDVDGRLDNVLVFVQYMYPLFFFLPPSSLLPFLPPSLPLSLPLPSLSPLSLPVGDGTIDYDELKTILKCCMNESSLTFTEDNLEELTRYYSLYLHINLKAFMTCIYTLNQYLITSALSPGVPVVH